VSAPFPLPLVFTAWGFRHGGAVWSSGTGLADVCKSNGVRTVAVQLGSDEKGQTNTTLADVGPLRDAGLRVVVWGVAGAAFALAELQRLGATEADWMPQIEGPGQRDLVLDAAASGLKAPAIVTNYAGAGDTGGEAAKLREAGVKAAFIECYNDAGVIEPFTDLERMLWQGTAYGWRPDELFATMGTYHGETPASYGGTASIGRDFGMYLAEPMTAAQWQAFGALNPPTPEPEPKPPTPEDDDMDPVSDNQGREAVGFAVQAAAQNWTSDKPKARLTVARRICEPGNDDAKWNAIRDEVVALLDGAGVPK
jgi:hypothetical protein